MFRIYVSFKRLKMRIRTFFHFQELPSTNTYAVEWMRKELASGETNVNDFYQKNLPAVFIADRQTVGRGRNGRRWESPSGCLMFSLVFSRETLELPPEKSGLPALAAGLAVRDTVLGVFPCLGEIDVESPLGRVGIHWPNDVYLVPTEFSPENFCTFKKLSGILTERHPDDIFVLGIGLNVHNSFRDAPEEIRRHVFSLVDISRLISESEFQRVQNIPLGAVLDVLLVNLERRFSQLAENPARTVADVETCCVQHGVHTTLRTPQGEITGLCTGLNPDGAIFIDGKAYYSGEIGS